MASACSAMALTRSCVSVSLPRLGGWRAGLRWLMGTGNLYVSVSLPRLGGWRDSTLAVTGLCNQTSCFSLVAEIGWLASRHSLAAACLHKEFQSRCRDWVVGEPASSNHLPSCCLVSVSLPRLGGWRVIDQCPNIKRATMFQSRCRDWVVGEKMP